jgi:hypothetical protein
VCLLLRSQVDLGYFTDDGSDLATLVNGVKVARNIAAQVGGAMETAAQRKHWYLLMVLPVQAIVLPRSCTAVCAELTSHTPDNTHV